jgi:beta-lactam-binding protein with PASTA domain
MAEVYLAHDDVLDRDIALKVMSGRYANDEEFVERFKREAQSAAALSHPNIVSIYDRGESEDGTYYIAMEYLPGGTLKDRILKRGALPARTAAAVALQIAEALQAAHKSGVVHRDIKPHNILITDSGDIKVTDFGIARAASSSTMTRTGSILGTAHYISPEQAMGESVGPASDLYSLGVVLYEMLTGELPFDADTPIAIAMKHVNGNLRPPREIDPSIPDNINAITVRLLAKDPGDRYPSDADLIRDLERAIEGLDPAEETTRVMNRLAPPAGRTRVMPVPPAVSGEKRRRRLLPLALALVLLPLIALLAWAGYGMIQDLRQEPEMLPVPDLRGMALEDAQREYGEDFDISVEERVEGEQPEGTVLDQDPAPETQVERGSEVSVTVVGTQVAAIPDVSGSARAEAERALRDAGFEVRVGERESSAEEKGRVMDQDPAGGERAEVGSRVTITVGEGPSTVVVPNLYGYAPAEAEALLEQNGLRLGQRDYAPSSEVAEGVIIFQNPSAENSVAPGTTVDVTVSSGPEQVEVPDVIGQNWMAASQALEAAGLTVNQQVTRVPDDAPRNTVVATSPEPGVTVEAGTLVTLTTSSGPPSGEGGGNANRDDGEEAREKAKEDREKAREKRKEAREEARGD